MRYDLGLKVKNTMRVRKLLASVLVLGSALGAASHAAAQNIASPPTSDIITPPAGNVAFLLGNAVGTQGYVCLPQGTGASWTLNAARPEATLFLPFVGRNIQIITHFLSPDTNPNENAPNPLPFGNVTWQSSWDSSKVWAQAVHSIVAGSDSSCPNDGAIACVLLQSIGSLQGPEGGKFLTKTTFIQRLNTKGGSAPADGCSTGADVGKQTLVPYTADYYFFRGAE